MTGVEADAITNLSSIVKDVVIRSHDKFKEVTRDIMWLNVTIHNQSELYMVIRQLEFALLQLTQQLSELMDAIQCILLGKVPVNILNPTTLHNILRNVSLHLPEGYELVAGTRAENVHLYYELVKVAIIGNAHGIKVILNVPLKTASRYFVLHKIIALPARISDDKFAQYTLDFLYFGLDNIQRNYILFTEADLSYCSKGSITVCPANTAIYSTQVVTCESSLFFQTADAHNLCRRKLLLHYRTPTLRRHDSVWVYHFPEQQHVTLRCWKKNAWTSRTEVLSGSGVLYNSSECSVTASEFQTLPELLGDTQATLNVPQLYVPDKIAVIASHELQALEEMMPPEIVRLDAVTSGVAAPRQIYDVDSLLHVNRFSLRREQRWHWYIIIITVLYTSTILGLLCFSLRSHLPHLSNCWTRNSVPTSDTTYQNPSTPGPSHDASGPADDHSKGNVIFTAYPLRQAN